MLIAKLSFELLEDLFREGSIINWKVTKGIPSSAHFVNTKIERDRKVLELWFTELEDCKEIDIEIEKT